MKKAEFLLEVMAEIDNIKSKATKEEIDNLNISSFDHESSGNCIYGQMTGACASDRAKELTPKLYQNILWKGKGRLFTQQNFDKTISSTGYTPLEKYLYMVSNLIHKKIIAYLKGETDTLELK